MEIRKAKRKFLKHLGEISLIWIELASLGNDASIPLVTIG